MSTTTMQSHAENYLNERRQLGFGLRSTGYAVRSFARYVDNLGPRGPLTVEVMADWARRDRGNRDKPATWARRLKQLRSFARYLRQFEPNTEIPDDTTFGRIRTATGPAHLRRPGDRRFAGGSTPSWSHSRLAGGDL